MTLSGSKKPKPRRSTLMFLSSRICTWRPVLLRYPEDGIVGTRKKKPRAGQRVKGFVRDDYFRVVSFLAGRFLLGVPKFFFGRFSV